MLIISSETSRIKITEMSECPNNQCLNKMIPKMDAFIKIFNTGKKKQPYLREFQSINLFPFFFQKQKTCEDYFDTNEHTVLCILQSVNIVVKRIQPPYATELVSEKNLRKKTEYKQTIISVFHFFFQVHMRQWISLSMTPTLRINFTWL